MRYLDFCHAKTKAQISFAVTAKLISAFVFTAQILQFLYFLSPKFPTSSHFLCMYSLVCVGPGRNPQRLVFSRCGSFLFSCNNSPSPISPVPSGEIVRPSVITFQAQDVTKRGRGNKNQKPLQLKEYRNHHNQNFCKIMKIA